MVSKKFKKKKQVILEPSSFCSGIPDLNSVNYVTDGALYNFAIFLPALTFVCSLCSKSQLLEQSGAHRGCSDLLPNMEYENGTLV